jgi:hypothetical protein
MLRLSFISISILLVAVGAHFGSADDWFPNPIRVAESKPVTVNDAKFVAVAQTEWRAHDVRDMPWVRSAVEVQFRITNLKKTDIVFPTFDTFGLTIRNGEGKDMLVDRGRKVTVITSPALIAPGVSYTLWSKSELRWDSASKSSELLFYDGTIAVATYRLPAGKYKVSFWYSTAHRAGKEPPEDLGNAEVWSGSAQTQPVDIEFLGP